MNLVPFIFFVMFPLFHAVTRSSRTPSSTTQVVPFVVKAPSSTTTLPLRPDGLLCGEEQLLVAVVARPLGHIASSRLQPGRLRFRGASSSAPRCSSPTSSANASVLPSPGRVWLGLADSCALMSPTRPSSALLHWLLMATSHHPEEVEECARGRARGCRRCGIVLPCPRHRLRVLFSFTLCWNEFTYASLHLTVGHKTAVVGDAI